MQAKRASRYVDRSRRPNKSYGIPESGHERRRVRTCVGECVYRTWTYGNGGETESGWRWEGWGLVAVECRLMGKKLRQGARAAAAATREIVCLGQR